MDAMPQLGAEELGGPVTLFTRFPGRPQIVNRRWDRFRVRIESHREDLADAAELGLDEPVRSGSDMAVRTGDPRVRRSEKARVFGMHDRMTYLPAELSRVGVMVPFVAADGDERYHRQGAEPEYCQALSVPRILQVQMKDGQRAQLFRRQFAEPSALAQPSQRYQDEPQDKHGRQNEEDPQSGVRVPGRCHDFDQQKGDKEKYRQARQSRPGQGHAVLPG